MDKKPKTRAEIDLKDQWDLTKIFKDDNEWYQTFTIMENEIHKISEFDGKLTSSGTVLYDFLELYYQLDRRLCKLHYYAHLKLDQDTTNSEYQNMKGKIDRLFVQYNELTSYFEPELMKIEPTRMAKLYQEEPRLIEYEFMLTDLYRFRDHILSEREEKIVSTFLNIAGNPKECFTALTNSDMKFGLIQDGTGNQVELTESNYSTLIGSKDRSVRKAAFEELFTTYSKFKNCIASTFCGNIESLTATAKIKKYDSSLECALFADHVDPMVYSTLIDTVNQHLSVLHHYFELKKSCLKLDEFHLYDIYVEIVDDIEKKYQFEDAKNIVLDALKILGDDYVSVLHQAFDQKWIDVYHNIGKQSGAYSSGFYDTYPYILLNFEGKINDVSTLAHELGHSVHTYYSCQNNSYQNSNYRIFVAEVASTVNELLLNHYLLDQTEDKNEKLYILNNLMELFKGTIYRQTMFAEFERDMNIKHENGEILTHESLSNDYEQLNHKYFGSGVIIDDLIRYEWERIPHFYYNFYVYKYAIGLSCACYIVKRILDGTAGAVDDYLSFLKMGGSNYPIEELKVAGVDVTDPKIVESAIHMFDSTITQFEKLCNQE